MSYQSPFKHLRIGRVAIVHSVSIPKIWRWLKNNRIPKLTKIGGPKRWLNTEIEKKSEYLKTEIDKVSQDLKELIKTNNLENLKINRNIYLLIFFVLTLIALSVYWSGLF